MVIKEINTSDLNEYQHFVEENGSIFNQSQWTSLYEQNLKQYGIFNKDNRMIGGFNLYFSKLGMAKYIKTPPFSPHIGLFICNNTSNASKRLSFNKKLIELMVDFVKGLPYQIVSFAFPPEFIDFQPFIWSGYKVIPNYTYRYDLGLTLDELKNRMSPERRNDIKKAEKDNLECKLNIENDVIADLVINTFDKKNEKIDVSFIKKIISKFNSTENGYSYTTYKDGQPLATSFCVHDNNKVFYLLGGYSSKNKHQGAGAMALWECIKHAKEKKIGVFDFEGSMIKPVEKYFRGYGAELTTYYFINRASLPLELMLKFVKRSTF